MILFETALFEKDVRLLSKDFNGSLPGHFSVQVLTNQLK